MGWDGGWLLIILTAVLCAIGVAIIYRSYRQLCAAVLFEDTKQGIGALLGFFVGTGFIVVPVMAASGL